jgi:hypothetical protein
MIKYLYVQGDWRRPEAGSIEELKNLANLRQPQVTLVRYEDGERRIPYMQGIKSVFEDGRKVWDNPDYNDQSEQKDT